MNRAAVGRLVGLLLAMAALLSLAASASSPPSQADGPGQSRRDGCLQFAVRHLQQLGRHPDLLAPSRPPAYALHSVFTETVVSTQGDLVSLHPVYRTVRGWDEKRRRPVLYQTLVHEERTTRAIVDWSFEFHLVLRQKTHEEVRHAADAAEHAAKRECAVDAPDECPAAGSAAAAAATTPSNQLLHVHIVVSEDKDGSRAITSLRSSSPDEVAAWYRKKAATTTDAAAATAAHANQEETDLPASERNGLASQAHIESLRRSYISLPRLLAGHYEPLAAAAAGSAADSTPPSASSSASSVGVGRVKALSVNIWNYNYWSRRLPHLLRVLRASSPDLIGFQEVRAIKSGPHPIGNEDASAATSRWQIADLARGLPEYEYVYAPAMGFREGPHDYVHEGLAVFSRYPIEMTNVLRLSRDPADGQDFHQRICLRARVRTPWGRVNMLSTHLSLSLAARARTLPEVSQFAAGFRSTTSDSGSDATVLSEPTILSGDFNAVFAEGPHLLTRREFGAFQDAWSTVHGHSPEADQRGWTFHAWDHRTRIDFLFTRAARGQTNPTLSPVEASVIGREGWSLQGEPLPPIGGVVDMRDTLFPSDHMFLEAMFRVEQQPPTTATDDDDATTAAVAPADGALDLKAAQKLAAELTNVATPPTEAAAASSDKPVPLSGGVGVKDEL